MRNRCAVPLALSLVLVLGAAQAWAQTEWRVEKTIHIGGPGGKDYATIDPHTHRLYVARGSHTNVIDTESGKVIADILGQGNSHGVAIVPSPGRGFISDGGADRKVGGAVVIVDEAGLLHDCSSYPAKRDTKLSATWRSSPQPSYLPCSP